MTVAEFADALRLETILLPDAQRSVTGGYTGDLLSWVMGRAQSGDCWITVMSNVNVAAVAQLADVACVVFAEGVQPDSATRSAAETHGINLLGSAESAFTLCAEAARLLP